MTVRPLGSVYFTYLISGSFCAPAGFCALATEPAQARVMSITIDRRLRLEKFTGVLHYPAEVISGFRQDNPSPRPAPEFLLPVSCFNHPIQRNACPVLHVGLYLHAVHQAALDQILQRPRQVL